jgi:hypothetical protein
LKNIRKRNRISKEKFKITFKNKKGKKIGLLKKKRKENKKG